MTNFFLTSLSFGVHSPRRCHYRALLSDHENKRFVIIVRREELQQADGRLGKAVKHVLTRVWDKNNPFSWGDDSPAHRVVALEVEWSSIVGIDYRCPLHDDGKLVLETRQVLKRVFKTVEDAQDFYTPRAPEAHTRWLRTSLSAAPTPSKMSLDDRHAMVASVSCAHLGSSHLPVSPRFSRPISCSPTAPVSSAAGAILRSVVSAEVRNTAAAGLGGSASAGSVWCVGGRGRAAGTGAGGGMRLGLGAEPEPGPRSVSASRAPRTGAMWVAKGSRAGDSRTMASSAPRSMDYASADEGEGGRHRRPAPAAAAAAPETSGGVDGATAAAATGAAGVSSRRRLQLRAVESSGAGLSIAPPAWVSTGHARQQQQEASPRKAKSTNDLCGMERERGGDARSTATSVASAAGAVAAHALPHGVGSQSIEWCASATASGTRISAVHRCEAAAAACSASWDYGGSLAGANGRSRGGGGGNGACSSSVDSLRVAFMSQQHQQLVAAELNSRWRHGGSGRVRREAVSWTQLGDGGGPLEALGGGDARGGGGNGRGSGAGEACSGVPRASRWTQPSATFCSKTLVLSFRDPFLPQELRRFVKSDMRLLKLYESGLPAWAVFMPSYGLPYRPWLRRALWLLFIAISVFSMGCGFYDLYKNVPFLKQVVTAVASRMYLPASELFEWLERHTQIRMSILLTYLFSKSPLLVSLMRALRSLAALLQQLLAPVAGAVSEAMAPLAGALQAAAASVGGGAAAAGEAVWQAAQPVVAAATVSGREVAALAAVVLGPPARALWALAVLLAQLVRLVAALVGMVLVGPVQLVCSIGGALSWAGAEVAEQMAAAAGVTAGALRWLLTLGRAARRAAPAVKAGARLAAQAAGAGGGGGGLSGGMAVWHWLGLEVVGAYNAVRLTFLQAFKSARAVMNFCVTVANTAVQHRVSLLLQLRRFITRQKERLPPAVAASVPLPFDRPLPGPDPDDELLGVDVAAGAGGGPGLAVGAGVAGLSERHHAPAEHHHALYDMDVDVDMVLMGGSEDEDVGGMLAAAPPPQLYGSNGGVNSSGPGAGVSGLSEPIQIPLGGRGAGLRRRRHHGVGGVSGGLGHGDGGSSGGGGNHRYDMYEVARRRLDAVDEEEVEDAQQLSDRDSLGAELRSGRRTMEGGGGGGRGGSYDRRRTAVGAGGTSGRGRNPWVGHEGVMQEEFDAGDYLAYASAPGCRNVGQGGGGRGFLAEGNGLYNGYTLRPSLSSPSRRQGRGLESVPLSRSVPAAAAAAYVNGQPPWPGQEAAPGRKEQQPLPGHKQQRQHQSRRARRQLARSASAPADRAATSGSGGSDANDEAGADTGGLARSRGPRVRSAFVAPAVTAGAVTAGVAGAGGPPALGYSAGNDPLTCSSPFVRNHRSASEPAVGPSRAGCSAASGGAASSAAQGGGAGAAAACNKTAAAGDEAARNKGRGGGAGGANNACGKHPGVVAKHVNRQQPAIQAA